MDDIQVVVVIQYLFDLLSIKRKSSLEFIVFLSYRWISLCIIIILQKHYNKQIRTKFLRIDLDLTNYLQLILDLHNISNDHYHIMLQDLDYSLLIACVEVEYILDVHDIQDHLGLEIQVNTMNIKELTLKLSRDTTYWTIIYIGCIYTQMWFIK